MGLRAAALIAPIALLIVGCAGSPAEIVNSATPAPIDHHCADLVAQAIASPDAPVPGAMACLDSSLTDQANASGIYDDADFQAQIANGTPVFNSATYCGRAHNGDYVYAMTSTDGTNTGRTAIQLDSVGLVSGLMTNPGTGCPQGMHP